MYIGNEPLSETKKVLQRALNMRRAKGATDGPLEYLLKFLNDEERVGNALHVDEVTKRRVHVLADDVKKEKRLTANVSDPKAPRGSTLPGLEK